MRKDLETKENDKQRSVNVEIDTKERSLESHLALGSLIPVNVDELHCTTKPSIFLEFIH